jgi:hypothetical protein
MKLIVLLFTGLFFTTVLVNAQTDFRPGYLVNTNGDTLRGEIDYRGDILMGEVCRFRLNSSDKTIAYSPDDIIEFKFNGSKYFVSKEVKGRKIFLEFLIKGKVNVYTHKDQRAEHFFIEKAGLGLSELTYEEGITYKDNTPIEFKSTTHIGLLNMYMQDAPEFQSRIAKMDKPKQKWLIDLAKDYHNKVCKDEKCIIFEKELPFLIVNLEIVAGVNIYKRNGTDFYYYSQEDGSKSQNYLQFGVLANFWLPRLNEKLYLRTGIIYSTFEAYNELKKYYKIPIQAEYIYPKGIIRPKLAYGINLYKPFNYTVTIMPGINFQLDKSINFEINGNVDFVPNYKFPLFPDKKIYAYGIIAGLYIKLQ